MKVLLADDDRVLTHLLTSRLRAKGVQTVVAHDAMQALMHAMRPPQPDVIVLDLQMQGGPASRRFGSSRPRPRPHRSR